jgi:thioredoxin-related protein
MQRKLKALILVIALAAVARAQAPQRQTVAEYDPKSWKPYTSQEGAFEISFPGGPGPATFPMGPVTVHLYATRNSVGDFAVSYMDVPKLSEDPTAAGNVLDAMRSWVIQNGATVITEQELTVDGVRGRELVASDQGFINQTRYFVVKGRLYTVTIATTPKVVFKNEKVTAIENDRTDLYREVSDQFFKSFKIDVGAITKSESDSTSDLLTAAPDKTNIYPADANAQQEIREALKRAPAEHKRILLVFGANWCYDCHVLDRALHEGEAGKLASEKYLLIHVNIGEGEKNGELVKEYKIPLDKGVPAVAVLDEDGKLLYSSGEGEFEAARRMLKKDLVKFLTRWKPL